MYINLYIMYYLYCLYKKKEWKKDGIVYSDVWNCKVNRSLRINRFLEDVVLYVKIMKSF